MYSFSTQLYPIPQEMFDDQSLGFGIGIQREIFYTIKDGNWSDITIWETASGRVGFIPRPIDDIYIRHTIVIDLPISVNNLFNTGLMVFITIPFVASSLIISGNLHSLGIIDCTDGSPTIDLYGEDNEITSFISGNSSVRYLRKGNQKIAPVQYYTLYLMYIGIKYIVGDLYVENLFIGSTSYVNTILDLGQFNADIGFINLGASPGQGNSGTIRISYAGKTVLFRGQVFIGNPAGSSVNTIDFSLGNPDVEFQNGISASNYTPSCILSGTGLWKFTTNNQSWGPVNLSGGQGYTIDAPILISGPISLKLEGGNFYAAQYNNIINGDDSASTLINAKNYGNSIFYMAVQQPMQTGVLDCNSFANQWRYKRAGAQEIKGTTYRTLELGGSGVKKLMGNVIINATSGGSLSVTGTATIDYNGFTITTI